MAQLVTLTSTLIILDITRRGARSFIQSIKALKDFAKLYYRDSNIKMNTSIILHKQAQKHKSLALLYWHQRIKTDVAERWDW